MATVVICGFEVGDTSELPSTNGTFSVQSAVTRGSWSSYAFRGNPTGTAVGSTFLAGYGANGASTIFTGAYASLYTRFYFRADTLPASNDEIIFVVRDTNLLSRLELRVTSAGTLACYNQTPTLLATGTKVLSTGVWYRIEVKFSGGTSSVSEWKVDDVIDGSVTTSNTGSPLQAVVLGKSINRNGNSVDFYYDDVLVSDSTYPGPGQVTCLLPDSAGFYQNWTPLSGATHYGAVNERPPDGDTNYLTSVSNTAETEGVANTSSASISGTINCVAAMISIKQSAGLASLSMRFRSGSTNVDLSVYSTTTSYVLLVRCFDNDPATGAQWTSGGVDGCEVGGIQAIGATSRVTFACVMVDYTPTFSQPAAVPTLGGMYFTK